MAAPPVTRERAAKSCHDAPSSFRTALFPILGRDSAGEADKNNRWPRSSPDCWRPRRSRRAGASEASAVRPFVTDDARVVYPGQLEIENFAEVATAQGQKPSDLARSLQGVLLTDRLEIIAGGFGPLYEHAQVKPVDLGFQPKYVLYRSFGAIPSVSVAAAELFPMAAIVNCGTPMPWRM